MLMDSEYRASRDIDTIAYIADVRTQRTLSFLAPLRSGRAEGVSKGGMTSILTVPKRHSPFGGLSWLLLWPEQRSNYHFAKWFLANIRMPLRCSETITVELIFIGQNKGCPLVIQWLFGKLKSPAVKFDCRALITNKN
ncbi:hypothetical protein [Candidatus Soleaferrea massiliensis]|uniref:hypothetical protein n=1 Tax=Candidatus Soleaferrea massiliensis TaxID=1470354 RepID=UPI0005903305|nr:hypothetical protein [Candidatus Soleaferrea massiliensis]